MTRFVPRLARLLRFRHDGGNRVRGLRRGHDAFAAREKCSRLENFCLVISLGFNQTQLQRVAHHRRHAVITQAARVN